MLSTVLCVPTVLVADDTESIRFLIRTNLELAGYDVIEAVDGVDCEQQLKALSEAGTLPDVVTIDVMMPRQGGVDTIERIRSDIRLADIPILIVSTQNLQADIERGFAAGADAYIVKPFDPDAFVDAVDQILHDRNKPTSG